MLLAGRGAGVTMELRRIIWAWDTLVLRLDADEPKLGRPLRRAVRPIAAERYADGRLLVVLGCWLAPELAFLADPDTRERLGAALSPMLEDQIVPQVVPWPAGMAPPEVAQGADVPAPDVLAGLPEPARLEAGICESALQRWFYARAFRRGLRPECQYVVGHYRLDFALPRFRVAAEVAGWEARHGPREREQQLGAERWRVAWFPGQEVHADVDRCVAALQRLLPREAFAAPTGPRRPPMRPQSRTQRNGYRERR
jgi:very-short-patch-repair endonuclease